MAEKIKGITVEIGGKTDELDKALKNVDKQIRATQTNLKEVDKLLKLDPKNTTLLKEKQKLLADQIGKTRDKLQALKKAQEEAKQMLARGEIGQEAYDALGKQIDQCEKSLQNLEKQAEETKKATKLSAEQVGQAFKDAGDKIETAGKKLAPFSAAAAAGLGAAVKTAASFDTSMSEVAAISGATGEQFDNLRKKAREMGESTKFSASEAADGFKYMAMAGWKTEDMLQGIDGVLSLAAASGEDLGTTSDIVTDALTAMGYSAKDAGRLADVMAAASSNANTNVAMLGETFKYAAAVGGSYGYTMEDIALATGLMANSGIKASQAGTSLRSIMTRLATNAGGSSKKLGALEILTNKLGVAFYNADGTMRPFRDVLIDCRRAWGRLNQEEQANYANTIAGKNAMTGWLALMNSAQDDFNKLSNAIDNSNGAAKGMADIMQDNLEGQLTILKSQLQELAISLGDVMMPTIRKIVGGIQEAVDWLNALDEDTKETIVTVGLVVAALAPVLMIGGKIVSGVGSLIKGIGWLNSAMNGMLGPVALVAAGIGTVVDISANYQKGLEEIRKAHAELTPEQQALADKLNESAAAWEAIETARNNAYKDIETQTKQEWELWEALDKIVDDQGKVVEGKDEEARILIDKLNEALGTELELVNGEVTGYKNLSGHIADVIQKKEAEALLAADQEAWAEAYKNHEQAALDVAKASSDVVDQEKLVEAQEKKVQEITAQLAREEADWNDETLSFSGRRQELTDKLNEETKALKGDRKHLEELKNTQETARTQLDKYNATLTNHDKLQAAIASGSTEMMRQAQKDLVNGFIDAEHGSKESLERQAKNAVQKYGEMRDIVKNTGDQMAKDASYSAHEAATKAINEVAKVNPQLASELKKQLNTINQQSQQWNAKGQANAKSYESGVKSGLSNVPSTIKSKLDLSGSAYDWGKDLAKSYASGITKATPQVNSAASGVAKQVRALLHFSEPDEGPLSDFHTYGPDMMKLFAQGIDQSSWQVVQAVQGVAGNIRSALQGTTVTAQLDQKSIPLSPGVTLNIANFNNYSDSDIRELTNEIMETAASFAARKGAVFA